MTGTNADRPPAEGGAERARGGAWGKLALVLASTLLTLAVVEVAVRLNERRIYEAAGVFVPPDPDIDGAAWEVEGADPDRFRFKYDGDSLVHIRSDNPDMVYEIRPNVRVSDEVVTNPQGFRDRPFRREKADDTYRIAAVGDSITFGWTQAADDVYVRRLESLLNAQSDGAWTYEVYNFGVGGYNAAQEVALLKDRVLQYNPDLILMQYCGNDDMIGYDGGLWRHFTRTWWRTWDFAKLRWMRIRERWHELDLVERSYAELADIAQEAGIPVLVALFPDANDPDGTQLAARTTYFAGLGFGVVNLFPVFDAQGMEGLMADIVHPNTAGHALAAEAIFEHLAGPAPPTPPGFE